MTVYELNRLNKAINTLSVVIWNMESSETIEYVVKDLKYGLRKLKEIKYGNKNVNKT